MNPDLRALRRCFEGAIPASIATCAADGTPNLAKLSQVHYVDDAHVALSYQFFNKTRENILNNARASVEVMDPASATHYVLRLEYLRTESSGPLFESMKARLAAIASHTGMSQVFRLLGSDVYRVLGIEVVPDDAPALAAPRAELLSGLRACLAGLAGCVDLSHLLDAALDGLERHWDIRHAMLLMLDPNRPCLYTVASRGYPESGVGSEVRLGEASSASRRASARPSASATRSRNTATARPRAGASPTTASRWKPKSPFPASPMPAASSPSPCSWASGCSGCCMSKARCNSASPMRTRTPWWCWPGSWRCSSRCSRIPPSNRGTPPACRRRRR